VRISDGRVKVTDFGLAKPMEASSEPALTAMGVVVGTPDYIAPEQARGEPIDERVDIYALGGSLYFLLAGVPPFRTGKPSEDKYLKVVARHLRNPAPDAVVTNPAADRELAALARRMMAKKRDDRPTYADLVSQLTSILSRIDPQSVPEIIAATRERSRPNIMPPELSRRGSTAGGHSSTVAEASIAIPRRGFPAWLVVFTLLCAGVLAAGLIVYFTHDDVAAAPAPHSGSGSASLPPAGMTLVTHPDGTPWFFIDSQPVSAAAYRELFDKHVQSGSPQAPVVLITYDEARGYAKSRGGRLPRPEEWARAATMPWFDGGGQFEWVESDAGNRSVTSKHGTEPRPDEAQKDVTFRVAKDL
jgi:serine/threonine protein kinase